MQVNEGHAEPWLFAAVYGSPSMLLRRKLFSDLTHNNMNIRGPWLTAGDFNAAVNPEEVSNPANWQQARCADFMDWIFQEGLMDLGFTGSKFTWMRGVNQVSFKAARLDRGLENQAWDISISLEDNKANLAHVLTNWNKEIFGRISQNKKRILARLGGVQRCLANRPSPGLLKLDQKLRIELEISLHQEELLWFQKSREEWIVSVTATPTFTT
ncbi:PREDICTED: uncharacterized protein LOC109190884 [Ipomoea nil]|uniref:uncharacterized protein LOC109190884 n=1 Tax=Ipomoea nil TaxID=35883 RepID=UPI000901CF7A|nr:PREDICTED: uncharacterized protein LOC109190884 [Ipomoea nil]